MFAYTEQELRDLLVQLKHKEADQAPYFDDRLISMIRQVEKALCDRFGQLTVIDLLTGEKPI